MKEIKDEIEYTITPTRKKCSGAKLFLGLCILAVFLGMSYAVLTLTLTGNKKYSMKVGDLLLNLDESRTSTDILIENAVPTPDEEGMKNAPYNFSLQNGGTDDLAYTIYLVEETFEDKTPSSAVRYYYSRDIDHIEVTRNLEDQKTSDGRFYLEMGTIPAKTTYWYTFKMWLNYNAGNEVQNTKYSVHLEVSAVQQKDMPLLEILKTKELTTSGNGLYEVSHSDAEVTYTTDANIISNLKQTELRYAGANPDNYVKFNNETWRIIVLVNTPEGQRVKLVRDETIGSYSWDSSESSVNTGLGVNDWKQADIMKLLNPEYESEEVGGSLYWNQSKGTCFIGANNEVGECDFSVLGLSSDAKSMIDTVTWGLGTNGEIEYNTISTASFYNLERGSDETEVWKGRIGLIYPSDYGYATIGANTSTRTQCLSIPLGRWSDSVNSDCKENDWLYKNTKLMTSIASTSRVYYINGSLGFVSWNDAATPYSIFPTIYLIEDILVIDGTGDTEAPYILSNAE